jgi:hypothetical protein
MEIFRLVLVLVLVLALAIVFDPMGPELVLAVALALALAIRGVLVEGSGSGSGSDAFVPALVLVTVLVPRNFHTPNAPTPIARTTNPISHPRRDFGWGAGALGWTGTCIVSPIAIPLAVAFDSFFGGGGSEGPFAITGDEAGTPSAVKIASIEANRSSTTGAIARITTSATAGATCASDSGFTRPLAASKPAMRGCFPVRSSHASTPHAY